MASFDNDKDKYFRIWEKRGETRACDQGGKLIKPFNPQLTGKYSYKTRINVMKAEYPNEES